MRHNRGILVFYVIVSMAFVTIFLTAAIFSMQNTTFLTKKIAGDTRAYWAAMSGLDYVRYRLDKNIKWPLEGLEAQTVFGKYVVTETPDANGIIVVRGVSEELDCEFYIAFSRTAGRISPASSVYTIVPGQLSRDANSNPLNYYSINNWGSTASSEIAELVSASSPSHVVSLVQSGVYVAVDARSGIQRCVLEKMWQATTSGGFDAAMYAGGDIDVSLEGANSTFNISQINGSRPSVYTNGSFSLTRDREFTGDGISSTLEDGTLFYRTSCNFFGEDLTTVSGLRRKKHMLLEKLRGTPNYPRIPWSKMEETVADLETSADDGNPDNDKATLISPGSYVFVVTPGSSEPKLYHFKESFLSLNGEVEADSKLYSVTQQMLADKNPIEGSGVFKVDKDGAGNPCLQIMGSALIKDDIETDPVSGNNKTIASGLQLLAIESDGAGGFRPTSSVRPRLFFEPAPSSDTPESGFQWATEGFLGNLDPEGKSTLPTVKSDGAVIVRGLVTGKGRLIVGDTVSFEAGSGVDNAFEEPSHIAIYAKGSVELKYISAKRNFDIVTDVIAQAITSESGTSYNAIVNKALSKNVSYSKADGEETVSGTLASVLKSLGYVESEAQSIVLSSVKHNSYCTYDKNTFAIVSINVSSEPKVSPPVPSCFRGVIYTWDNFTANADGGNFSLDGAIVAFGGDPGREDSIPGGNGKGNINVKNCSDFKIHYDPEELNFMSVPLSSKPLIKEIYYNKLM